MEPRRNDIDEMIVHEKTQAALEYQNEAWADGIAEAFEQFATKERLSFF